MSLCLPYLAFSLLSGFIFIHPASVRVPYPSLLVIFSSLNLRLDKRIWPIKSGVLQWNGFLLSYRSSSDEYFSLLPLPVQNSEG